MSLELVAAASAVAVSTADAKAHMRVDTADDDAYIDLLIAAATGHFDGKNGILNRALIDQTWNLKLDAFPSGGAPIRPPLPPLKSVTLITYVDTNGVSQTWAASNYIVDVGGEPGRIALEYGQVYPSTRAQASAVTVQFVAGYGAVGSDIPPALIMAIKHLAAHWYENREAVVTGTIATKLPLTVDRLISPFRVRTEF